MRVLQVLDHVGIYLVIVGTMTPFMLVSLHHHTSARILIIVEWVAAFLGSMFAGEFDGNYIVAWCCAWRSVLHSPCRQQKVS